MPSHTACAAERVEFEASVVAAEQRNANEALARGRTHLNVLTLASEAAERASVLGDLSPDRERRACRAGCSACCHLAVAVTPPEAILIAEHLRETLSPAEFELKLARVAAFSRRVSDLTLEGRARARVPCALLGDDGACTIYGVRPLGCRGWTSFAKADCDAALAAAEPGHSGPMDYAAFAAANGVSEGLRTAARAAGLEAGHYEFHSAVLLAMREPAAADRWARGEGLFTSCAQVWSEKLRREPQQ
jgi:hypothetical protein